MLNVTTQQSLASIMVLGWGEEFHMAMEMFVITAANGSDKKKFRSIIEPN